MIRSIIQQGFVALVRLQHAEILSGRIISRKAIPDEMLGQSAGEQRSRDSEMVQRLRQPRGHRRLPAASRDREHRRGAPLNQKAQRLGPVQTRNARRRVPQIRIILLDRRRTDQRLRELFPLSEPGTVLRIETNPLRPERIHDAAVFRRQQRPVASRRLTSKTRRHLRQSAHSNPADPNKMQ